jgi:hypothetical protein
MEIFDDLRKNDIELRKNFISIDKKAAINSYGEYFKIGQRVGHEGANENDFATITFFEINDEIGEVKAHTDKGWGHIDFMYTEEK